LPKTITDLPQQITGLLIDWNNGSAEALEKLMPLVEVELRRIAANHMRRENPGHTLQTTALVNEAYLKLVDQREVRWQNRAHFFALSSQLMRRILLDHARAQKRGKRGGDAVHVDLEDVAVITPEKSEDLIALDEALTRLAQFDPSKSKIVEMRFFGGLSVNEIAEVLGIAPVTVMLHWRLAKAWLRREIGTVKTTSE
jgi:RNA polymerase sigma-70 factor (ECF subfamily)